VTRADAHIVGSQLAFASRSKAGSQLGYVPPAALWLKSILDGADVLLMGGAPDGFTVGIETEWEPPSPWSQALRWLDLFGNIDRAASGEGVLKPMDPAIGKPRWRVVLKDTGTVLAASQQSQDYQGIELLQSDWLRRIGELTAAEIRSRAHRWAGETVPLSGA
jgi:hypothetical protein